MAVDQLKVAFSILKELSEETNPSAEDYGLSEKQFAHIILDLQDKGYIKGALLVRTLSTEGCKISEAYVTLDGLQFLHDNSALMKTYRGLKEVRDWIPFAYQSFV